MLLYASLAVIGVVVLVFSILVDDLLGSFDFGPDWLTGVGVSGFVAVLGLAGIAGISLGWSETIVAISSIVIAFMAAFIMNFFAFKLMKSSAVSLNPSDLIGLKGRSVLGASANSSGEVMLVVQGSPLKVNGRCSDDLKPGDSVLIVEASSMSSVVVEKV